MDETNKNLAEAISDKVFGLRDLAMLCITFGLIHSYTIHNQ